MSRRCVVVFGTFDPFHPGHKYFLEQAQTYGDDLVVVVTCDSMIRELKHRLPYQSENERMTILQQHGYQAVLSDPVLGSYQVLQTLRPEIICYGHDQNELANDLRSRLEAEEIPKCQLIQLQAYQRQIYSSTLLRPTQFENSSK